MKAKYLAITLLSLGFLSCDQEKPGEKYFAFDESILKTHYKKEESAQLLIVPTADKEIDSVAFFANEKRIGASKAGEKLEFNLSDAKLGYQNLKALVYYNGKDHPQEILGRLEIVSSIEPKLLQFDIVNTYPHDVESFTQGLEFYNDTLVESTGQKGRSWVRKVDYKSSKAYSQVNLTPEYFGEGITILDGQLFQLTWQEKTGFIYDAKTLKKVKEFTYDQNIEGWGLTNDGTHLYWSDGTEKIWKVDPKTQKHLDYVNVYTPSSKIKALNELEFVNGKIYGNVWQKDAIAVIDPSTGAVEGILDISALRKQLTHPQAEVSNGIAYRKSTNTFFLTGKNWDKMFEIRIKE